MVSEFRNNTWSAPTILANGVGPIIDLNVGYLNSRAYVAYITDNSDKSNNSDDRDIIDDRNLTVIDVINRSVNLNVTNELMSNLQFIVINGTNVLTWYENGDIRFMTVNGQRSTLISDPNMHTDNYRLFSNGSDIMVVHPSIEDDTGHIFVRLYSAGKWEPALIIEETGGFARAFDGIWKNDELSIVFNDSHMSIIDEGDEVKLSETNNLCALRISIPNSDIDTPPTITNDPQNQTVTEENTATFSVSATGTVPLLYQWQRLYGSTWSNIGTNAANYSLTAQMSDNGAQFRVIVSNGKSSVTSNVALLTVNPVHSVHVPVTGITGVSTMARAGVPLNLTGKVAPANATNNAITWNVKDAGGTEASITDNTLNTTAIGTVVVMATIADGLAAGNPYVQDFTITVTSADNTVMLKTTFQSRPSTSSEANIEKLKVYWVRNNTVTEVETVTTSESGEAQITLPLENSTPSIMGKGER